MWIVDSHNSMEQQNGRNQCCICNPHTVQTSVKMTLNIKHFYSMARHIRISLHLASPLYSVCFGSLKLYSFLVPLFLLDSVFFFFFRFYLYLFYVVQDQDRIEATYVLCENRVMCWLKESRSTTDRKDSKSKCGFGFCDVNLCFRNFIWLDQFYDTVWSLTWSTNKQATLIKLGLSLFSVSFYTYDGSSKLGFACVSKSR